MESRKNGFKLALSLSVESSSPTLSGTLSSICSHWLVPGIADFFSPDQKGIFY